MRPFSSERDQPEPDRERPGDATAHMVSEAGRQRWESAIDDPEARAFLKRAMERRERMEREGLIHKP